MRGDTTLATSFGCERWIARKAAVIRVDGLAALATSAGRQFRILSKAPLFRRNSLTAFTRNLALFLWRHCRETALGLKFIRHVEHQFKSSTAKLSPMRRPRKAKQYGRSERAQLTTSPLWSR